METKILKVLAGIFIFMYVFVWDSPKPREYVEENEYENIYQEEDDWNGRATLTVYNPIEAQCDSDPLITADNSFIDTVKLKRGDLRWIAVSRDILKRTGFGKKVRVTCKEDSSLSGDWEIHDVMNKRYSNRIDVLAHQSIRSTGNYSVELEILED